MSAGWLGAGALGLVVLLASIGVARQDPIPAWEQRVFRSINRLPGWLYVPLWPVMQLGNLVVGTVAGLLGALVVGHAGVAIGVVLAMVLKLVIERLLRRLLAGQVPARQRPGTSEPDAILRGDVPARGASFPSGHIVLVAAIACIVGPVLPTGWDVVPFVLTVGVMVGRVYVGAHNPMDVTAGLGAGLIVGGVVAALVA
jgi:membrane-associated phospholipid phosphatase